MKTKSLVMVMGLLFVRTAAAGHFWTKVMAGFHILLLGLGGSAGLPKTRPLFPSGIPIEISAEMAREMGTDTAFVEIGERTHEEYMRLCQSGNVPAAYDASLVEPENPYGERKWYCQRFTEAMRDLAEAKTEIAPEKAFSAKVATDVRTVDYWWRQLAHYSKLENEISYRDSQLVSGVLLRLLLDDAEGKFSDWSAAEEQRLERFGLVTLTSEYGVPVFTERFEHFKRYFQEVLRGERAEEAGYMAPLIEMVLTQSRSGENERMLGVLRRHVMSEEQTQE